MMAGSRRGLQWWPRPIGCSAAMQQIGALPFKDLKPSMVVKA
jgi:hypothetical protein